MGDMADVFNEWRAHKKQLRADHGQPCPRCIELLPKAQPKILLPGQICKMHKYRDPRKEPKT